MRVSRKYESRPCLSILVHLLISGIQGGDASLESSCFEIC